MAPRTEFHPRASSDGRMGTSIREQGGCIAPHSSVVVVVCTRANHSCASMVYHLRRARRHLTAVVQATIVLTTVFALIRACAFDPIADAQCVDRLLLRMSLERVRSSMVTRARALLQRGAARPKRRRPRWGQLKRDDPLQSLWYRHFISAESARNCKESGHMMSEEFRRQFRHVLYNNSIITIAIPTHLFYLPRVLFSFVCVVDVRVPYSKFEEIVTRIRSDNWFPQGPGSENPSATGKITPVELFVLGVLKVLGRGYVFDDLSGPTGISREAHRVFFHMYGVSLLVTFVVCLDCFCDVHYYWQLCRQVR